MSDHHDDHEHDESTYPIIWEVQDDQGRRLTMLVQPTREAAEEQAKRAFGFAHPLVVIDTGKRKPPNKCCNTCGPKPCGS